MTVKHQTTTLLPLKRRATAIHAPLPVGNAGGPIVGHALDLLGADPYAFIAQRVPQFGPVSPIGFTTSARRMIQRIPDTTCTIIPNAPHDLMLAHAPARTLGVGVLAPFCSHRTSAERKGGTR